MIGRTLSHHKVLDKIGEGLVALDQIVVSRRR